MNATKTDPLIAAMNKLRQCLTTDFVGQENLWVDAVHHALGAAADAIQEEVRTAEQDLKMVGEINPDFQNAPVADRHVQGKRDHLIQLGERVHQLRADLRQQNDQLPLELIQVRLRGQEIANTIENVRKSDDKFLLEAENSNPGAGD